MKQFDNKDKPFLGYGLGLRPEYYDTIVETRPDVDWFEILSENYMVDGGKPLHFLDRIRENYPVVMHGVSMSIGSTDPLNKEYLKQLKQLIARVQPRWISDHLCWTGQGGQNLHDLMPLPYNEEAIAHVVDRVQQVQDYLGQRLLLENVSSYVTYVQSEMTEWEFYSEIVKRADCLMLFDVNNIYVSARNHGFDPLDYIRGVPAERVWQCHLAGHSDYGDYVIDTHDHPVAKPVWDLYAEALKHFGPVSSMIERDDQYPPFDELLAELSELRDIAQRVIGKVETTSCPT
ncbi:MAG: DUF692 domain-containing protein [Ectothiorhodospiraceae bacterium]|nr:DUF692 domain-containing protein [Ectothiorhodospiraceae bacterium]